jgi:hypothetical protein
MLSMEGRTAAQESSQVVEGWRGRQVGRTGSRPTHGNLEVLVNTEQQEDGTDQVLETFFHC